MSGMEKKTGQWHVLVLGLMGFATLAGCAEKKNPPKTDSKGASGAAATGDPKPGETTPAPDGKAAPAKPRILFLSQSSGFRHGSVTRGKAGELSPAEVALKQLAESSGAFTVSCTQDGAADLTEENLKNYDIVWFYTTSGQRQPAREAQPEKDGKPAVPARPEQPAENPVPEKQIDYLLNTWLKQKGHGFIGSHSASDTYHEYKPYWDMIGGTFSGHPWGNRETVTIAVHEPDHAVAFGWGPEFQIQDEIYQYKNWQPEKVRVIMSLDMAKCKTKMPYHVPVAWVKQYGEGRVYYNNLGHNETTWTDRRFQDSLVHAITWVAGRTDGPAEPNPEVSKAEEAKAKAAVSEVDMKQADAAKKEKAEAARKEDAAKPAEPAKVESLKKDEPTRLETGDKNVPVAKPEAEKKN